MEEFDSNIIIIVGSILAILLLIILYVIIKPKKQLTDDEIYEIKREQDTEVFDENTDIKSLEKAISKEKRRKVDIERNGSILNQQMQELIRRGKDPDSNEFDKKNFGYQYQTAATKLKLIEENVQEVNSNLEFMESMLWARKNQEHMSSKFWQDLKSLDRENFKLVVKQVRDEGKSLDLPIEELIPTSGETVSGRTQAYDDFMSKIKE
tara:strand:- start:84 stop:707 length:624 start_codon:yes stop_codon:yes gene_type:complete